MWRSLKRANIPSKKEPLGLTRDGIISSIVFRGERLDYIKARNALATSYLIYLLYILFGIVIKQRLTSNPFHDNNL